MQEGLIIFVYQWIPSPATWSRHGFDMNGEVTHTVVEMNWVQSSPVCKQKQSWEIQEKERKGFEAEGNYALRCVCVGGGQNVVCPYGHPATVFLSVRHNLCHLSTSSSSSSSSFASLPHLSLQNIVLLICLSLLPSVLLLVDGTFLYLYSSLRWTWSLGDHSWTRINSRKHWPSSKVN